jgi:hypothetical protein
VYQFRRRASSALKSLVIDGRLIYSAASYSLVRGALENIAAGFWLLHPPDRHVRVEHGLRWWSKNFVDQDNAIGKLHNAKPLQAKLQCVTEIGEAANCDLKALKKPYTSTAVLKYADHPYIDELESAEQPSGSKLQRKPGLSGAADEILKCTIHDQRLADAWNEFREELLKLFQKGMASGPEGYVVEMEVEIARTDEIHFERYRNTVDMDFDYLSETAD